MSRARDLSRLSNPTNFTPDGTTGRVGLGSENPTAKLNVAGIVSATAFYGDGSNLEGVASAGLGTAVEEDSTDGGQQIYFTDTVLAISGDVTVNPPDSSNIAYTQYQEISVDSGADLIIGDGDDLIPDILGISSDGQVPGVLAGGGGRVRADNFSNKAGTGAPTFSSGVNITGVATAASFSGTTGTFSGDVSIGGTLTYEDVTNIDSVGLITARSGVKITGGELTLVGTAFTVSQAGVVTATSFVGDGSGLSGVESWNQFDTWLYSGG